MASSLECYQKNERRFSRGSVLKMVVMVTGALSHSFILFYFLFCPSRCAQSPQLHIASFNNLVISPGAASWQRGAVKTVCVWMTLHETVFVASLAKTLIRKLELLLALRLRAFAKPESPRAVNTAPRVRGTSPVLACAFRNPRSSLEMEQRSL